MILFLPHHSSLISTYSLSHSLFWQYRDPWSYRIYYPHRRISLGLCPNSLLYRKWLGDPCCSTWTISSYASELYSFFKVFLSSRSPPHDLLFISNSPPVIGLCFTYVYNFCFMFAYLFSFLIPTYLNTNQSTWHQKTVFSSSQPQQNLAHSR